jgi:predicted RNA-binding Zn ribbon-like protein
LSKHTGDSAFELCGGHPALDLVNTLDWRFRHGEQEELLPGYAALLRFMEESGLLTAKEARRLQRLAGATAGKQVLEQCIELREALAHVFYAALDGGSPEPAQIRILERYFKLAQGHQKLRWKKAGLGWKWPELDEDPETPLWLLSSSASGLMLSDDAEKVRACDNPECRWLFLDTSKNHTRRWCDMRLCGNRMKARRFKAQRKG